MKKLKIFTGLINFLAAAIVVVFAFFSLKFASNFMPEDGSWPTFFLATVYPAFEIVLCVIAFLQVVYALYYMFAHPRVRSFYSVGCVFCVLDIAAITIICYLAAFITREITVCNYALLCAFVCAVLFAGIVLKIICVCKFNPDDPDGAIAAEQKKLKKAEGEKAPEEAEQADGAQSEKTEQSAKPAEDTQPEKAAKEEFAKTAKATKTAKAANPTKTAKPVKAANPAAGVPAEKTTTTAQQKKSAEAADKKQTKGD